MEFSATIFSAVVICNINETEVQSYGKVDYSFTLTLHIRWRERQRARMFYLALFFSQIYMYNNGWNSHFYQRLYIDNILPQIYRNDGRVYRNNIVFDSIKISQKLNRKHLNKKITFIYRSNCVYCKHIDIF